MNESAKAYIEERFPEEDKFFLSFHSLKSSGIKILFISLFKLGNYERVYLFFNDQNYKLLENFVQSLSLLIPKFRIIGIYPDMSIKNISFMNRFYSSFVLVISSFRALIMLYKLDKITFSYSNKPFNPLTKSSVLYYIKTNLSFGSRAGGSFGHISGVCNELSSRMTVKYLSAEEPVMISPKATQGFLDIGEINFSFPYEANTLKVNSELIRKSEEFIFLEKPDCLYSRLSLNNYTGAFLSNKYNIPLIVEYNGSEVWIQCNWSAGLKYHKIARKIEDYVLHSANLIVTVSEVLRDELLSRGICPQKVVFYPNCIDPNIYNSGLFSIKQKQNIREDLGFHADDLIFTFIGTFGIWHGVEFLAESIVRLVDQYAEFLYSKNVKFMIIGDGLLGNKVKEMLCRRPYEDFVTFTGLIPQKVAPIYLAISDAFLSPHVRNKEKFIGSPTKLFEYMAFAKPIIASNLDQISNIFESKLDVKIYKPGTLKDESAIVFEPNDRDHFISSILFLIKNYDNLTEIGCNAHALVMRKYTWDKHVDKILNRYNKNLS